jgi:hypothetical protein
MSDSNKLARRQPGDTSGDQVLGELREADQ